MTAKTDAQRQQEKRTRDKLREDERLARLLARRITLDVYKGTDYALIRCMVRAGIEEPHDIITRLIHGADRLSDAELAALVSLPSVSRKPVTNEKKEITCATGASAAASRPQA
ncbi:hypothetical protein SAMN05216229_12360 [Geopseudomonas sagittaria]|uniref:Uncharacterized protein n=1 Tax=Geopseudomonas sagittaria TaxID=1135990 RepID=A0A1I5YRJ2_9GAMM|nr:hypothetical protein [Pseudomonas sagittaria]SFQ46772.1 hypothetical protein SAMN05216229_12360 [Pseudomonas sagittaria]